FDALGRVVREIRPQGRGETRFGYDLDGRLLVEERDHSGGTWRTENSYDASGRRVGRTHPDGTVERWSYRPDDVVASWTTRDGVVVSYTYDAANRLLAAVPEAADDGDGDGGGDGEPEISVVLDAGDRFEYDALSRLLSASRGSEAQRV